MMIFLKGIEIGQLYFRPFFVFHGYFQTLLICSRHFDGTYIMKLMKKKCVVDEWMGSRNSRTSWMEYVLAHSGNSSRILDCSSRLFHTSFHLVPLGPLVGLRRLAGSSKPGSMPHDICSNYRCMVDASQGAPSDKFRESGSLAPEENNGTGQ